LRGAATSGRGSGAALRRNRFGGRATINFDQKVPRLIGVSNYTAAQLRELLSISVEPPAVLQSEHHPFFCNREVREVCEREGIAFMAYGPFGGPDTERKRGKRPTDHPLLRQIADDVGEGGGLDSRQQSAGPRPAESSEAVQVRGAVGTGLLMSAVSAATCARAGATPAQVVLKWAMAQGISVLPKTLRQERLAENLAALSVELSVEQLAAINRLDTGQPSYWDPNCVDTFDSFNVYLDREAVQRELDQQR